MISYDKDFYSWTQEQAELLKNGRFSELDIDNLIEEVESMGRSEKRELESRLTILLLHLLKWKYQEIRRGRRWQLSIDGQRIQFEQILNENPGLKPALDEIIEKSYRLAVIQAALKTKITLAVFPECCPWTLAQLLEDGFYPD